MSISVKWKNLDIGEWLDASSISPNVMSIMVSKIVFNCVWSKLKQKYINIQHCNIRNLKLPWNRIWHSFEESPDNFVLLYDLSTPRSKENEHQGKGYGGGGGHAFEDV